MPNSGRIVRLRAESNMLEDIFQLSSDATCHNTAVILLRHITTKQKHKFTKDLKIYFPPVFEFTISTGVKIIVTRLIT